MDDKYLNIYIRYCEGSVPVLLEMPHSGLARLEPNDLPQSIASKFNFEEFDRIVGFGCDASVPEMTGFNDLLKELDTYRLHNDLARVYCDTNRDRYEASDLAFEDGSPNDHHHGVIWIRDIPVGLDLSLSTEALEKLIRERPITLKAPLTKKEFEAYMSQFYDPYHEAIRRLHKQIVAEHGYCIHLALHSMPAFSLKKICGGYVCGKKASRGRFDITKNTLPDIILIHNDHRSTLRDLVVKLKRIFRQSGRLIVEDGQGPFKGDIGVTKKYGSPFKAGVSVIGIEHVAHDLEPERHLGRPTVNLGKAHELQSTYFEAIANLC